MSLSYITLAVALALSTIAAYYSIAGLTAIFAAAVIPIIIMGGVLEVAKIIVTVWLHEYWAKCRWAMKAYLSTSVIILMFITSMGIFGFLSKAHSDQSLVSGDVAAKIAIYDEKIKISKENIDANRRALKQMDEAVDQVMGRSADEKGADKAVALRRSQAKERTRLLSEITAEQKTIAQLSEERAPIAAEVRKVEAEVGPIKYIAALVYGDNPDANLLERAVRWVIILLVVVFDPLAIMMLLAATESLKWDRKGSKLPDYEPDDGPLTNDQVEQIKQTVNIKRTSSSQFDKPVWPFGTPVEQKPSLKEQYPYLFKPFDHFENLKPMVAKSDSIMEVEHPLDDFDDKDEHPSVKQAMKLWKEQNPNRTLKEQRALFEAGKIDRLPWLDYMPSEFLGFGADWPLRPVKGATFMRIDQMPNVLYKFNGSKWIIIDKTRSDQYTYDIAYIDYLIEKISSGEYDTDLLTQAEQDQIELRLQQTGKP